MLLMCQNSFIFQLVILCLTYVNEHSSKLKMVIIQIFHSEHLSRFSLMCPINMKNVTKIPNRLHKVIRILKLGFVSKYLKTFI